MYALKINLIYPPGSRTYMRTLWVSLGLTGCPKKKVTSQNFKVALSGEPFVPGGCPFQKLMYS